MTSPYVSTPAEPGSVSNGARPGPPRLDDWIADPAVRTHISGRARADAATLWRAATSVKLSDTRTLGRLVRWRIPGLTEEQTFHDMFRAYPFALLAEGEHWSVSGLCGRLWTFAHDYPELRGEGDFRDWDEPGTVRVIFAHWTRDTGDGYAELHSEERIEPLDDRAARRLKALWRVVGPFKGTISSEPLPIAIKRAERGA